MKLTPIIIGVALLSLLSPLGLLITTVSATQPGLYYPSSPPSSIYYSSHNNGWASLRIFGAGGGGASCTTNALGSCVYSGGGGGGSAGIVTLEFSHVMYGQLLIFNISLGFGGAGGSPGSNGGNTQFYFTVNGTTYRCQINGGKGSPGVGGGDGGSVDCRGQFISGGVGGVTNTDGSIGSSGSYTYYNSDSTVFVAISYAGGSGGGNGGSCTSLGTHGGYHVLNYTHTAGNCGLGGALNSGGGGGGVIDGRAAFGDPYSDNTVGSCTTGSGFLGYCSDYATYMGNGGRGGSNVYFASNPCQAAAGGNSLIEYSAPSNCYGPPCQPGGPGYPCPDC